MEKFTAVWRPAWYALDQKIARGLASKFILHNNKGQLEFFSGMGDGDGLESIYAKITRIHNSALGEVEEIDTYGLSYRIWLPGNEMVQLNAEEQPGKLEGTTLKHLHQFSDLTFNVELEKLYPSDIGALDMLPVMMNDEVPDFFRWAGQDYDEIKDISLYTGAMVHYLLPLMKDMSVNEMKIRHAMMFIDKIYTDNNPLLASIIDESVLHPLALKPEAQQHIDQFFTGPARERAHLHRTRVEIIDKM